MRSHTKCIKPFGLAVTLLTLVGCASQSNEEIAQQSQSNSIVSAMRVVDISNDPNEAVNGRDISTLSQTSIYSSVQGAYKGKPLTHNISDYVKALAHDLITNMEGVSSKTPIAVTHFALLDSNLSETNLLGHQMAESFVHELHNFDIPVLDFKATEYVRVTEKGDFLLSRDYLELASDLPTEYVLTGTLTKHQGGYLVNARVLGLTSKAVVASAQSFIPFYVVDALIPSHRASDSMGEGVMITEG